jgi:Protein of unknown function DUF45
LDGASKIIFDDIEDLRLVTTFHRFNTHAFDGSVPETGVRWGIIHNSQGFACLHGCLVEMHDALSRPHIFIDQRLRNWGMFLFADLVLLHEMCHFAAPNHDAAFVKHLLQALQWVSWGPLVGRCTSSKIPGLDE